MVVLVLVIYRKESNYNLTKRRFVFFICTYSNQIQNRLQYFLDELQAQGENLSQKIRWPVIKEYISC